MKKILLATVALLSLNVGMAFAAAGDPGTGVLNSVHDMRNQLDAGGVAIEDIGGNDRVCAFCHTPHHAYLGGANEYYPLWSRQLDVTPFTQYNTSTINAADWAADIAIGPTRLCMSCHDGSIALDQHYGSAGTTNLTEAAASLTDPNWFGGAAIGSGANGLKNDHPVGFNYDNVAIGPEAGDPAALLVSGANIWEDPWIRQAGATLNFGGTYTVKVGDRLYTDPLTGTRYMTCATCHDVHNKKNQDSLLQTINYLVLAPQANSALCLTCHIK